MFCQSCSCSLNVDFTKNTTNEKDDILARGLPPKKESFFAFLSHSLPHTISQPGSAVIHSTRNMSSSLPGLVPSLPNERDLFIKPLRIEVIKDIKRLTKFAFYLKTQNLSFLQLKNKHENISSK